MSDQQLPPPSWPSPKPSTEPSTDGRDGSSGPAIPPAPGAPPPPTNQPPPPGAPWSTPGSPGGEGSGPPPPDGTPGTWAPPPTPTGSKTWWILGAVVLVVLVGAGLGLGLAPSDTEEAGTSSGSATAGEDPVQPDTDPGAGATEDPGAGATEPGTDDPGSGDAGAPDPDDPGDFEPAVAEAHRDLFSTIDESERTMIELQQAMPPGTAELGDDEVTAFRDRAGEVAGQLEDLHDELEDFDDAGSADVTAIREQYLLHLQDWVDWSSALADDPTLLDRPDAAAPYSQAINDSAAFFADAVADNLDRDRAPGDAVALADEIIERGFDSDDGGTEI